MFSLWAVKCSVLVALFLFTKSTIISFCCANMQSMPCLSIFCSYLFGVLFIDMWYRVSAIVEDFWKKLKYFRRKQKEYNITCN